MVPLVAERAVEAILWRFYWWVGAIIVTQVFG